MRYLIPLLFFVACGDDVAPQPDGGDVVSASVGQHPHPAPVTTPPDAFVISCAACDAGATLSCGDAPTCECTTPSGGTFACVK